MGAILPPSSRQAAKVGRDWEQQFAALTERRLDAITELVAASQQPRVCAHVTDTPHIKAAAVSPVDINMMAGTLVDAGWGKPLPFSLDQDSPGVNDDFHTDDAAGAFTARDAVPAVHREQHKHEAQGLATGGAFEQYINIRVASVVHTDIAALDKMTTALTADTLAISLKYHSLGSSSTRALVALRSASSPRALSPDCGGHNVDNDHIHTLPGVQGVARLYMLFMNLAENKRRGAPRDGEEQCAGCDRL